MELANGRTTTKRALLAVLTIGLALPAFGQSPQPSDRDLARRVALVSIPDRKLAVMEGGVVIATFPVAVGATVSPSPTGEFQIVSRVSHPTYYHSGKVIPTARAIRWVRDGWGSVRRAMAFTERMRRNRWDTRHRTAAFGCTIATWSNCSRCCESVTRL